MAPLPDSSSFVDVINHGTQDLLCTPAKGTSIALFYLANYLAHCATVKPYPAETLLELAVAVVLALFFPSSGIIRALDSIFRHSRLLKKDELQRAARAGALCMVCRARDWQPRIGDHIRGLKVQDAHVSPATDDTSATDGDSVPLVQPQSARKQDLSMTDWRVRAPPWLFEKLRTSLPKRRILRRGCKIHGIYTLPDGYEFTYVPSDAKVAKGPSESTALSVEISSSYSAAKTAIAVGQTAYAAVTLYQARGDQITLYGYASFGLTVTPYVIMSILNLIGQLLTPDYPLFYLVHNEEMDEARSRGGYFDGVVGSLCRSAEPELIEWIVERLPPAHGSAILEGRRASFSLRENRTGSTLGQAASPANDRHQTSNSGKVFLIKSHALPVTSGGETRQRLFIPSCSQFDRLEHDASPGRMQLHDLSWQDRPKRNSRSLLLFWAPLAFGSLSLFIIGLISHFSIGQSTKAQRAWTMSWLICGMILGCLSDFWSEFLIPKKDLLKKRGTWDFIGRLIGFIILFGVLLAPAVGGFVVVGQMLSHYGTCTRVA